MSIAATVIGASKGPDKWKPQADWWDMKAFYDAYVPPAGMTKYAFGLLTNVQDDTPFSTYFPTAGSSAWFATTDGAEFGRNVVHTWDKSKDKPCALGYKTRGFVICGNPGSVFSVSMNTASMSMLLWLYMDHPGISQLLITGHNLLEAVELGPNAAASSSTLTYYGARGSDGEANSLRKFAYPKNLRAIPANSLFTQPLVSEITWPEVVDTVNTLGFSGCRSLPFDDFPAANPLILFGNSQFNGCNKFNREDIIANLVGDIPGAALVGLYEVNVLDLRGIVNVASTALRNTPARIIRLGTQTVWNPGAFELTALRWCTLLEIADGWVPTVDVNISYAIALITENFVTYFLQPLGINVGAAITITIPVLVYNQLTADERQIAVDKGYILASA